MRNFLGWEPKPLTSKSSVSITGSNSDAPLAVSSNHTYILFPGLQLRGDAITLSLSSHKTLDDKHTNRPGWAVWWACPWHRVLSSRCILTHLCHGWHRPLGSIIGHPCGDCVSAQIRTATPTSGQQVTAGTGGVAHLADGRVSASVSATSQDSEGRLPYIHSAFQGMYWFEKYTYPYIQG